MEKDGKKIISIDLDDCVDDADDADSNCNYPEVQTGSQSEGGSGHGGGRKNKKITKAVKEIMTNNSTKFMSNFDPESSNRERRKLNRKFNGEGKKGSVYDENGVISGLEKDVCDCLVENCPGCHFPCLKCRSCKCGVDCRVNRKWVYETVENEAQGTVIKNLHFTTS